MTRINTNVSSLKSIFHLRVNSARLGTSLERLASGFRINRAADDPPAMVISELLHNQGASINQAITNAARGSNMISTAEAAMNEVNSLLIQMRDLAIQAAGSGAMSQEEIDANQVLLDSAIDSIRRIAATTSFGDQKLLNGELDFTTSSVRNSTISNITVQEARFPRGQNHLEINVRVKTNGRAQQGLLSGMNFAGGVLTGDQTVRVIGNEGTETLTFANGVSVAAIAQGINEVTANTGVIASTVGNNLYLLSREYGSDQFVMIEDIDGSTVSFFPGMNASNTSRRAYGKDVEATINGNQVQASGWRLFLNTDSTDLQLELDKGFPPATGFGTNLAAETAFYVTGGGALFQVGPNTDANNQIVMGFSKLSPENLGKDGLGFLADIASNGTAGLDSDPSRAVKIIDEAIRDVLILRGRLGSFETNVLKSNIDSLSVAFENIRASESTIRDTDFAGETANLAKYQILVNAGISVLSTANTTPQSVLQLLG